MGFELKARILFVNMEFPREFTVQEKTKVFNFGGFKVLFLIKVKSYSGVEGFVRR